MSDQVGENDTRQVEALLAHRGLEVAHASPAGHLFLPSRAGPGAMAEFYGLMKHYSFRLLMRDVILFQDDLRPSALIRFVDPATVSTYLEALIRLGMIEPDGDRYRLPGGPVRNFGGTLEWFVARVLADEFRMPAIYGVRLRNTSRGGDYDVIAAMGSRLVYIETKSSPPKHIENREVAVFFGRLADLRPDLAIFLVDTNLRMLDKVVRMFEESIADGAVPGLSERARSARPERLEREIFHLGRRVFLTNSKHELIANLRICFFTFHAASFDLDQILSASVERR